MAPPTPRVSSAVAAAVRAPSVPGVITSVRMATARSVAPLSEK